MTATSSPSVNGPLGTDSDAVGFTSATTITSGWAGVKAAPSLSVTVSEMV